jgi:hypothetical protein
MSNDVSNLSDTIIPKSDQLNADQLLGTNMTIRVTGVKRGSGDDQPVVIHYEGDNGRPYKPCKSMRKVLIFAWGEDGSAWVGRLLTLYNKADVKFGGVAVGGIRISHMSDIKADLALSLNSTRGKKEPVIVKKLDASDPTIAARANLDTAARAGMDALKAAWAALPNDHKNAIGGKDGCPAGYKATAQAADKARTETPVDPTPEPEPVSDPDDSGF